MREVEWLWYPYIPFGKLTIIQGDPGEGKTTLALRLAAACSTGRPMPGMESPFNVIYQSAEDGLEDTVKPRLTEAGADQERVINIREDKKSLHLLDSRIEKTIGQVAQRTGCAIVLVGHLNKATGMSSAYRGLGSIDFRAAARSVLVVGRLRKNKNIRVIVRDLDPDEATLCMIDSNLHREHLLPSEKAYAYKAKMEMLNRQGQRYGQTSSQPATKWDAATEIGKATNESRDQVFVISD